MLGPRMLRSCKHAFCFAFAFPLSIVASAQTKSVASSRQASGEQKTARALELARANPLALRAFLVAMPKGGDLHNHLSGALLRRIVDSGGGGRQCMR